eukprot:CAMPEP_0172450868 /NCGR_PEP_ID=MMETSP1065-20121228/9072_1 /TAXON_ID=265537 /ORGANISM="Amphiprora paludosa, Strain CCMP125" /LENGTH=83 /DNA_ID=CAMNT_0013202713 /DNA_START=45 /DNA_END=293 /DNA_ORIENTATION=+
MHDYASSSSSTKDKPCNSWLLEEEDAVTIIGWRAGTGTYGTWSAVGVGLMTAGVVVVVTSEGIGSSSSSCPRHKASKLSLSLS